MVYNLRFDKFKKEIDGETWGVILVTFSQSSKTKVISTGKRISRKDYDEFLSKEFKRFKKTSLIDYRGINAEIESIISTRNPFEDIPTPIISDGYISFMKKDLSYIPNLSTRKTYSYAVLTFENYLISISHREIPLNELTLDVFKGYKAYLDGKLSFGTIRYYFTLHRSFIAKAFDEDKTKFVLSLKRFKLENNGKKPTVLSDDDINELRKTPRSNPFFINIQFSMLQLFANGIRFSDCLLIKLSDFKNDYLEIHQMKTNRVLQVPYSPMLIDTVCIILGFDYTPSNIKFNNYVNELLDNNNNEYMINQKREFVLNHIWKQKDRFLFDFVDPILFAYKKGTNMSSEQHQRYILHRVNHNNHLKKINRNPNISVPTLTSHSMRYAYTRIALENEIPLRTLSHSLGHSSIVITEKYIRDNFQIDNYKIIGEMMTLKYKET